MSDEWKPFDTAPKDGTWIRLRGLWTTRDGFTVRWAPGFWQTRDGWAAAYDFREWRYDLSGAQGEARASTGTPDGK